MSSTQNAVLSTQNFPSTLTDSHMESYASDAPSPFEPEPTPHASQETPTPAPDFQPSSFILQPSPSPITRNPKLNTPSTPQDPRLKTSTHPLLAPGSLSLLVGDPGTGKSLLAIDLAARLSRSLRFPVLNPPRYRAQRASSLILSLEDTPDTLSQRILAANADPLLANYLAEPLDLIPSSYGFPKAWLRAQSEPQPSSLLARLQEYLPLMDEGGGFRLLILDPLPAFLGVYDCSHQGTIRRLLQPLLALALERKFAILGISHLAKPSTSRVSRNTNPLHATIGSLAYTALARTVLLVTHDTLTHNPNRRLVIPLKNNAAPLTQAWSFTLQSQVEEEVPENILNLDPNHNPNPIPAPSPCHPVTPSPCHVLQWSDTPITHHPLLNQPSLPSDALAPDSPQLQAAKRFVTTMLANGPIPSGELFRQATSVGLSRTTIQRARDLLNVTYYHDPETNKWMLTPPTIDRVST